MYRFPNTQLTWHAVITVSAYEARRCIIFTIIILLLIPADVNNRYATLNISSLQRRWLAITAAAAAVAVCCLELRRRVIIVSVTVRELFAAAAVGVFLLCAVLKLWHLHITAGFRFVRVV
jgi:hypothetical protein